MVSIHQFGIRFISLATSISFHLILLYFSPGNFRKKVEETIESILNVDEVGCKKGVISASISALVIITVFVTFRASNEYITSYLIGQTPQPLQLSNIFVLASFFSILIAISLLLDFFESYYSTGTDNLARLVNNKGF